MDPGSPDPQCGIYKYNYFKQKNKALFKAGVQTVEKSLNCKNCLNNIPGFDVLAVGE